MSEEKDTPPARGVACKKSRGVAETSWRKGEAEDRAVMKVC